MKAWSVNPKGAAKMVAVTVLLVFLAASGGWYAWNVVDIFLTEALR